MLKAVDRAIAIGPVQLREKRGGRSGDYRRS
jgi:molybdenum cofactor biosynthesis enzyme